jgi:hypothetical protein
MRMASRGRRIAPDDGRGSIVGREGMFIAVHGGTSSDTPSTNTVVSGFAASAAPGFLER